MWCFAGCVGMCGACDGMATIVFRPGCGIMCKSMHALISNQLDRPGSDSNQLISNQLDRPGSGRRPGPGGSGGGGRGGLVAGVPSGRFSWFNGSVGSVSLVVCLI